MKRVQKFVVIAFRLIKGRLLIADMREARGGEASAIRLAEMMSQNWAGAAAFEVHVEEESGDMHAPRLLAAFGSVPDLDEAMEAAA